MSIRIIDEETSRSARIKGGIVTYARMSPDNRVFRAFFWRAESSPADAAMAWVHRAVLPKAVAP